MEFQEINFMLKLISFLTILQRQGLDQMIWGHDEELQTPEFKFKADTKPGYGHKPEY